jgi:hypothetical protein
MSQDHPQATADPAGSQDAVTAAPAADPSRSSYRAPAVDQPAARKPGANHPSGRGVYSRLLAKGGSLNGSSREGRFLRATEDALARHVAPNSTPSIAQKLLIRRISRAMLQLELLDEKKKLTDHDLRLGNALDNRVRLGLKALGLKPGAKAGPSLAEYLANHANDPPETA